MCPTVSGPPRNLTLKQVTNTTATIEWTEPETPNGKIKGYRIYISGSDSSGGTLTQVQNVLNSLKSSNITGENKYAMESTINNLSMKLIIFLIILILF